MSFVAAIAVALLRRPTDGIELFVGVAVPSLVGAGLLFVQQAAEGSVPLPNAIRGRARKAQRTAWILLAAIAFAILGGGYTFYNAGELAATERQRAVSVAYDDRIRATGRRAAAFEKLNTAENTLAHDMADLKARLDQLEDVEKLVERSRKLLEERRYDELTSFLSNTFDLLPLSKTGATQVLPIQAARDVSNNAKEVVRLKEGHERALREEATAETQYERAVAAPTANSNTLQTLVIRAGVTLLLIFLVQILSALQRYNVQLGAHYDALADVLLHAKDTNLQLTVAEFSGLIAAFRPSANLGRSPRTVPQEAAELVAAAMKR